MKSLTYWYPLVYRPSAQKRRQLHRRILQWYRRNGRDLLWRRTRDPYAVCVSEIMLHQTQADRVSLRFPRFLKQFPTLKALARAPRAEVIKAWEGMGYNNRAVRLSELARTVVDMFGGVFPVDPATLITLPGIGKYTANAVAAFAFGAKTAIVDVNVRRVLSRIFWRMRHPSELRPTNEIWRMAEGLLPKRNVYDWNQALLDLGATVCTSRRPLCNVCPVGKVCASRPLVELWPHKIRRRSTRAEPSYAGILERHWRGRIIQSLRKPASGRMISIERLGRAVKNDFRKSESAWLGEILRRLQRDGLLIIREARGTRYVRLAHE